MRTNAETLNAGGAETMMSHWHNNAAEPQSSFVKDLKKELGLRSEMASRKAD